MRFRQLVRPCLLTAALLASFALISACKGTGSQNGSTGPTAAPAPSPGATVTPHTATSESVPKIVAFGDSLTAGYGLPQDQSYPVLLQNMLDAGGYRYDVVNAGVSGDTSAGGLRRIDWALEGSEGNVRIVILELGANDILRGQPIPEMKKNLGEIIKRAKRHGSQVLLCGMESPTNSGIEYRRQVHEAYQELAKEHRVAFIPFFLEGVAGIGSLNQPDGIHPNAEGTKIVAETVYRALSPLLERNRR